MPTTNFGFLVLLVDFLWCIQLEIINRVSVEITNSFFIFYKNSIVTKSTIIELKKIVVNVFLILDVNAKELNKL